jgi:hypothetical protein
MVPLYVARVADLRIGNVVSVTCRTCGRVAELRVSDLRQRLPLSDFVKHIGLRFRCQQCGSKGAEVDARRALGHYG